MVEVSSAPMSTGFPLLVGAGPLPELKMRQACEALARACRCPLTTVASGASPAEVLQTNPASRWAIPGTLELHQAKQGHLKFPAEGGVGRGCARD